MLLHERSNIKKLTTLRVHGLCSTFGFPFKRYKALLVLPVPAKGSEQG